MEKIIERQCNHDWSDEIITFHNINEEMKKTEFMDLPDDEKEQLHVSGSGPACCKCGIEFTNISQN